MTVCLLTCTLCLMDPTASAIFGVCFLQLLPACHPDATYTDKKGRSRMSAYSDRINCYPHAPTWTIWYRYWSLDILGIRRDRIPQTVNSHLRWHCLGPLYPSIPLESQPSAGRSVTACQIKRASDPKIQNRRAIRRLLTLYLSSYFLP